MKKSKKVTLIVGLGVITACIAVICYFLLLLGSTALPWIPLMCSSFLGGEPSVPQTTYAEFPFTIVYELSGEEHIYKNKIICEYIGVSWDEANGKFRNWQKKFDDGEDVILYMINDKEYIVYQIRSSASYLMGDRECVSYYCRDNRLCLVTYDENSRKDYEPIDEETAYDNYGIRITSFQITPPIENTFGSN